VCLRGQSLPANTLQHSSLGPEIECVYKRFKGRMLVVWMKMLLANHMRAAFSLGVLDVGILHHRDILSAVICSYFADGDCVVSSCSAQLKWVPLPTGLLRPWQNTSDWIEVMLSKEVGPRPVGKSREFYMHHWAQVGVADLLQFQQSHL
jgi:hypothetical protein